MDAWQIVLLVLVVLAGLAAAKRLLMHYGGKLVEAHVARNKLCETCFVGPRIYLVKTAEAPIAVCQPCAVKKLGGVVGVQMMLESGRIVRAE